jgi:hypothetical protein
MNQLANYLGYRPQVVDVVDSREYCLVTAAAKSIKNAKGNQDNEWHLSDFRGGNNLPYVRIKKN